MTISTAPQSATLQSPMFGSEEAMPDWLRRSTVRLQNVLGDSTEP